MEYTSQGEIGEEWTNQKFKTRDAMRSKNEMVSRWSQTVRTDYMAKAKWSPGQKSVGIPFISISIFSFRAAISKTGWTRHPAGRT